MNKKEEKKVKEIKEELGYVTLNFKSGKKQEVPSKTIYTYYEDGTNDCTVEIVNPLTLFGKQEEAK